MPQGHQQRRHARFVEARHPIGQVADLHGAGIGDVDAPDLRGSGALVEPGAGALGAGLEGDRPLDEGPDVRLHRLDILGQERLLDLGDEALVGEVDPLDLDLGRLLVQQVGQLALGVVPDRLVHVEEAAAGEDPAIPAVHAVARDRQRTLAQRLAVVIERGEIEVAHRPAALAPRAHAARDRELAPLLDRLAAALDLHRARAADRGDVERKGLCGADMRLAEPAEEDPQEGERVGRRAHRRARVGAHPLLVDDDRRRQAVEHIDIRPGQGRHEALHEGAVGLVDHPLRLGRDGVEDQRTLARPGHAREDGQPPLGDLDVDVLEVVLARAVDPDEVVAVGGVDSRLRGHGLPSRGVA
jgi:hypothetical protein